MTITNSLRSRLPRTLNGLSYVYGKGCRNQWDDLHVHFRKWADAQVLGELKFSYIISSDRLKHHAGNHTHPAYQPWVQKVLKGTAGVEQGWEYDEGGPVAGEPPGGFINLWHDPRKSRADVDKKMDKTAKKATCISLVDSDIEMSDDDDIEMMGQEEYLMKHRVSSARGEV
jgi:hypothetical protein